MMSNFIDRKQKKHTAGQLLQQTMKGEYKPFSKTYQKMQQDAGITRNESSSKGFAS